MCSGPPHFGPIRQAILGFALLPMVSLAQDHSVVRQWSEEVRGAIRRSFAKPPLHARNLFHIHAAMYDAWAAYEPGADTWLLGKVRGQYTCPFHGVPVPDDVQAAREEAISHAAYRLIAHRYANAPGVTLIMASISARMTALGYDASFTSTNYLTDGPAALGNYIAQEYIAFGLTDGSNEAGDHAHLYYTVFNPPIAVEQPGNPTIIDPNRWQQITLTVAIDQQGNPVPGTPDPVGHDWGHVVPFALDPDSADVYYRDGMPFPVYHDPGPPALIDTTDPSGLESFYKWNHLMVSIWQSHLDPADPTLWDISPGAKGNIQWYPTTREEYEQFYNYFEGGDPGEGRPLNPVTGLPYEPQWVKRADYARVLAEFWADGPNSETPPGHWFEIMHHVMDHPLFERRWMGQGDLLDPLEYDAKAHLVLGAAVHDAAITAWSIKGWYDYVRPVSAIRYMGDKGQCSDPQLPHYHPAGMPLIPGYVELVQPGDPLAGANNEHVGKIKLFTWRGHAYVPDPLVDLAGVGWILAENWWPYQRVTFVTPPFSGYISGHSTYSSTAAEVLTRFTGSPFFPGGMSNFLCAQNEFLHFEEGPSQDVVLQWATYRDASDQCSLSRIWGGIHPPIDDIPGRLLGMRIGEDVVDVANTLFLADRPQVVSVTASQPYLNIGDIGNSFSVTITFDRPMDTTVAPEVAYPVDDPTNGAIALDNAAWTGPEAFTLTYTVLSSETRLANIFLRVTGAKDLQGKAQNPHVAERPFTLDTDRPTVVAATPGVPVINDAVAASGAFTLSVQFSEPCDPGSTPFIIFTGGDAGTTLQFDAQASGWQDEVTFAAVFTASDANVDIPALGVQVNGVNDPAGNAQTPYSAADLLAIDTRNPVLSDVSLNTTVLNQQSAGGNALVITLTFDEPMDTGLSPSFGFPADNPVGTSLFLNPANTLWVNNTTYRRSYNLLVAQEEFFDIDVALVDLKDPNGNPPDQTLLNDLFIVDTRKPAVTAGVPSVAVVSDSEVGAGLFSIAIAYSEPMDTSQPPLAQITGIANPGGSFTYSAAISSWTAPDTFTARFIVADQGREEPAVGLSVGFARDAAGNTQTTFTTPAAFALDTRNPEVLLLTANTYTITNAHIGPAGFFLAAVFDEAMDTSAEPAIGFVAVEPVSAVLTLNSLQSQWLNNTAYRASYDVANVDTHIEPVGITMGAARDLAGNTVSYASPPDLFAINVTAVGMGEHHGAGTLFLYPNPLPQGQPLWLRLGDELTDAVLSLIDARGAVVLEQRLGRLMAGEHVLALPPLPAGPYLLRCVSSGTSFNAGLVVSPR